MKRCLLATLALLLASPAALAATELTVGVFLPNASFASNAERSAYAERVAAAMAARIGGDTTVRGRAFAKTEDLLSFLRAGEVDLLVTDPLFQSARKGKVLAHAVDADGAVGPRAVLYALPGTGEVMALAGKPVSVARSRGDDAVFYAATALSGEVAPDQHFASVRETKDVQAALGAVKANVSAAAFAPLGHPAASGLRVVASGGRVPLAVLVAADTLPDGVADAAVGALTGGGGQGGGIAGWRSGAGEALRAARAGQGGLTVRTERPVLAPAAADAVSLPRIRLETDGRLPPIDTASTVLEPTLPE